MQKVKRRSITRSGGSVRQFPSRSLAKGLEILDLLAARQQPAALREISSHVALGKASTLRLLHTLEEKGYLKRDEAESYALNRPWSESSEHDRQAHVREAALPVLAKLNVRFGETVALAYLFEDVIRVIEVLESTHHIRMSNYRGGILQPYASSLGKAISAFQTPDLMQRILYTYGIFKFTSNTLTDFRAIHDEFESVRERGYATDREETVPGGSCIGVPIFGPDREVRASFSISMPKARMTVELEQTLPQLMMERGAEISAAIKRLAGRG